jgi:hypothetical protein
MTTRRLVKGLYMAILAIGLAGNGVGCDVIDKLKGGKKEEPAKKAKDKDEEEEADDEEDDGKKKSASAEPSATASAAPSASASAEPSAEPSASADASAEPPAEDEVTRYPDEQPASGSYYTKKGFTVYKAADEKSKELGKLGTGTLITLEASRGNWLLVKWPSGIGELSLGWIQVIQKQTTILETQDKPDATLKPPPPPPTVVPDAGNPTIPDAGKIPPKTDAGGRPPIKLIPRPHK